MNVIEEARKINDKLIEIREYLHKNPELSFQEVNTSRKIVEVLQELGLDEIETGVAKTGVVGLLRGSQQGKTFAMRADMDALPIQEANNVPYRSQNNGVMHACGHDTHVTMVLGSAMILSKMRDSLKGNIKFIFQPAEEIFGGAKMMIDEGVMEKEPKIDTIVGIHVWSGLDVGTIGVVSGPAMASADRLEIFVRAKGGHVAIPHLTADPIVASAQIINALQTVVSRSTDPLQPIVLSICHIEGGHAFNIIPSEVRIEGTLRTLDDEVCTNAVEKIKNILKGIENITGVQCEFNYEKGSSVLINDDKVIKLISEAGSAVLGEENVMPVEPTMGGEDFTYFTRVVPGAMFCLGIQDKDAGIVSPVHRDTFDISSNALSIGTVVLVKSALMYLES
ncbi:TPA: amidohydrolase [bacterium]|nr:amidohydrolase [bacterium]